MSRKVTIIIEEDGEDYNYPYFSYKKYSEQYWYNSCSGCPNYGTGQPCSCIIGSPKITC